MQHQPQALPDGLEFAVHVSDRPKLRLDAYPPGLTPLVLGYSKVWKCGDVEGAGCELWVEALLRHLRLRGCF